MKTCKYCGKPIPEYKTYCNHSCCMRWVNSSPGGKERNAKIMANYNKSEKHTLSIIKSNCTRMIQRAGGPEQPLNFYIIEFCNDKFKIGVAVNLHIRIIRYREPIKRILTLTMSAKEAAELEMNLKYKFYNHHLEEGLEMFPLSIFEELIDEFSKSINKSNEEVMSMFNDYQQGCI